MESADAVLARSPKLKRQLKAAAPLTRNQEKLLSTAAAIREAPGETELTFMARQLVQCTLPHSNPGDVPSWKRRNGKYTLSIKPGTDENDKSFGFPYGVIPRLLLFWITTEALRTKSRRIELGHSLSEFMRGLGLDPSRGGKRSDVQRLQDQQRRLFKATISFHQKMEEDPKRHGERWLDMQVAPKGEFWWDPHEPGQGTLFESFVILGEDFYDALTSNAVPVDMRVLLAIKRSPLALDLYAWVTWRVFKISKPMFIPWDGLMQQMGGEYARVNDFIGKAKGAFRKIRAFYPALNLTYGKGGFTLYPCPPAIAPRAPREISA
jgi:hypothetical protein